MTCAAAHAGEALAGIEVGAQAMALVSDLAKRVASTGGGALVVDYGRDALYDASLQALRRHAQVDPLERPGTADLSSRVDFSALRCALLRQPLFCSLSVCVH